MQISQLLSTYEGRIPRSTDWVYMIALQVISIVVNILCLFIGVLLGSLKLEAVGVLFLFLPLVLAIPGWRVMLKRGHDLNHSAMYIFLLGGVPVIGPLWLFVQLGFMPGTVGDNRYGPDPRARGEPGVKAAPA